jgi:hypothetical protein
MVAHVTSAAGVDKTGEKPCPCGVGLKDHRCNQHRETGQPTKRTGKMGVICPEGHREKARAAATNRRVRLEAEKKKLEDAEKLKDRDSLAPVAAPTEPGAHSVQLPCAHLGLILWFFFVGTTQDLIPQYL